MPVALLKSSRYIYVPELVLPVSFENVIVPKMSTVKSTPDTTHLIAGCLRNDRRSQQALYQQYCGALLSVCLSYAKDEETAVEVLQDGFLKIFQQMHTFNCEKSALYTWMRTVMVRTAIDALRRGARQPGAVELKEEVHDPVIDAEAVERMSAREILHLLNGLPPTTRAVFQLYVQEGYNHREIGEQLQISEGTSKWHLSEARKYLSNSLKLMERA
jgi:RNA polymerase sigma-70 factor (ECF subfamily)